MTEDYLFNQFHRQATSWDEADRPERLLIHQEKELMIAYIWNALQKNKPDHPAIVNEFISESMANKGGSEWYDTFLRQRSNCSVCFETYKIENLSVCPKCKSYYCPRCNKDCYCDVSLIG